MANALKVDLEGKTVVVNGRRFLCQGGFGCRTFTSGTKIFGTFLDNGHQASISGYDVEKLEEAKP